jgi:two-component system, OmpR family, phosphate regulon sensor histidine kinase PhoR
MENVNFHSVLLVEDEPAHVLLIKRALKEFSGEIQHAENLASALTLLESYQPDLIITDLNLPDSMGVTHIEQLRQKGSDAPIVVLTSSTSLQDAVEAMQLGARDFMVKNFDGNFREVLGLSLSRLYHSLMVEYERGKLQREMDGLRLAIENSNDAFAVVDSSGQIQYSNRSFDHFVKRCGGESSDLHSLFSDKVKGFKALHSSLAENLRSLPQGAVWNTEVGFCEDNNMAFDLSLSVIDSQDQLEKGSAGRVVLWVKDISEVKRREKFQREILSTTSHDLKGPLGAISLSSEMLAEMLEQGTRPYEIALRVGSSAQGAINLIDEFLSARRLEEGTFILKPTLQNIESLISEVVANFSTIAAARKIDLSIDVESRAEACVDKMGFSRVLGNLLSNALKFTPKDGRVWVRGKTLEEELLVEVEDTGSGMEASEIQKVFERFSRLERHNDVAGTGLGLFVVKSIISAHGGKIDVTSQVGRGTTFRLNFPYNPPVNERGELIALDFT